MATPLPPAYRELFVNRGGNYDSEEGTLPSAQCTTRAGRYGQRFYSGLSLKASSHIIRDWVITHH